MNEKKKILSVVSLYILYVTFACLLVLQACENTAKCLKYTAILHANIYNKIIHVLFSLSLTGNFRVFSATDLYVSHFLLEVPNVTDTQNKVEDVVKTNLTDEVVKVSFFLYWTYNAFLC